MESVDVGEAGGRQDGTSDTMQVWLHEPATMRGLEERARLSEEIGGCNGSCILQGAKVSFFTWSI